MRKNPIESERSLTLCQVSTYRHPLCKYENKCLNKAVRKGWRGFSCEICPFFRKYKKIKQKNNEIRIVYMQEVWQKTYIC